MFTRLALIAFVSFSANLWADDTDTVENIPQPVLVTGADGFVGQWLVLRLRSNGVRVRAMVRSPRRVNELLAMGAEVFTGEFTEHDAAKRAVQGMGSVIHTAGIVGNAPVDSSEFVKVNSIATADLATLARDAGVKRFVFISSISALAELESGIKTESSPTDTKSRFPYSLSKAEAEFLLSSAGLPTVIVRPGIVYGPGDENFLGNVYKARKKNLFVYVGDRNHPLNLTYVENLMDLLLLALVRPEAVGQILHSVDAAPENAPTWKKFMEMLETATGLKHKFIATYPFTCVNGLSFLTEKAWSMMGLQSKLPLSPYVTNLLYQSGPVSAEATHKLLNYQPRVGFEEAMKSSGQWLQAAVK